MFRKSFQNSLVTSLVIISFISQSSFASPFRIVGAKALGIGGANVAVADGIDAQYWNPGALGVTTGSGFQIPVNASYEATGNLLEKTDAIVNALDAIRDTRNAQLTGDPIDLDTLNSTAKALNNVLDLNTTGTGAIIEASAGLQNRFGKFAVSFNQYADVGMLPIVDSSINLGAISGAGGVTLDGANLNGAFTDNAARNALANTILDLSQQLGVVLPGAAGLETAEQQAANQLINTALSSGLTQDQIVELINRTTSASDALLSRVSGSSTDLNGNRTRVNLTGAAISELSLGYGHPVFNSDRFGLLSLGGNIKALRGEVGFVSLLLLDGENTSVSNALDDARKNTETSVKPAVDVGLLYRFPFKHRLQMGLLGRNLNSPTFDTPQTRINENLGKYKEEAQVRTGIAFWPLKRWMLSADVDVTNNETTIPGFKSQTWGVGTEFKLWLLDLRAGLLKNFEMNTPLTYTGGLGLNFGAFKMEVSGAMSSETVKFEEDGADVPANAQVGINIGLVFGRGQDKKDFVKKSKVKQEAIAGEDAFSATPAAAPQQGSVQTQPPDAQPASGTSQAPTSAPASPKKSPKKK